MAIDYTTTALLASVKRRGQLPTSDDSLSDADVLALASDELHNYIVPLLMSVREEFFAADADTEAVSGTAAYAIPERAIGMKLRYVRFSTDGSTYPDLVRIEPEDVDQYSSSSGAPAAYYLRGNDVVLVPAPSAGTLRLGYFRRPNRLVLPAACAKLDRAHTDATQIMTYDAPATFVTGVELDFISGTPGFDSLLDGVVITDDAGFPTSFDIASGVTAATGDYACLAGESPIPQIPVELRPLLEQRTVVAACDALGLTQKKDAAEKSADRLETKALTMITPRDEGANRKVINRHAPGWTRGFGARRYRVNRGY